MATGYTSSMHGQALMGSTGEGCGGLAGAAAGRSAGAGAEPLCEESLGCPASAWPRAVVRLEGPTSLDDLRRGADVDGDTGITPLALPPWMDFERYDRGRAFFREHTFALVLAWHSSLVIGFSLPQLLAALVFTGASASPEQSLKRYTRTFQHLAKWHLGNIFDPAGPAFASVHAVRTLHSGVRAAMDSKLPRQRWITMYDMACVQAGFIGLTIDPGRFGARSSQKSLEDFIFFWKCVGYQLGIADRFNVCSLGKAISDKLVHEVFDNVVLPDIASPPADYQRIAQAYIDGLNLTMLGLPFFTIPSSLALTYYALRRPRGQLSWLDTGRFYFFRFLFVVYQLFPPFRWLLNWSIVFSIQHLPDVGGPDAGGCNAVARCPFSGAALHMPPSVLPVACPHAQAEAPAPPGRPRCSLAGLVLLATLALALAAAAAAALCGAMLALRLAGPPLLHILGELTGGKLAGLFFSLVGAAGGGA